MKERTVTVWSMSKEYALCGLKLGYSVSSKEIIERMGIIQSQTGSSTVPLILQKAAMTAIETYNDELMKEWISVLANRTRHCLLDCQQYARNIDSETSGFLQSLC